MRTISLYLIFAVCFFLNPLTVFSAEEEMIESIENASKELLGQIASVDIENYQIVVEYQLEGQETVSSTVFYISNSTEVYQNGELIPVSELKQEDNVVVSYQINEDGSKVITELTLNN